MGVPEGEEWEPFAGLDLAAERACRRFSAAVPFAGAGGAPPRGAAGRGAAPSLPDAARRARSRPRRRSAGSSATSPPATARWPSASSPPRPTSPSRPISAAGSIGAASSTAPSAPTPSATRRSPRRSAGRCRRRASTSSSASPRTTCSCCWPRSGSAGPLFGERLMPIGTLYDPFINRGLDALNYACYQDARFMLVATPVGHHAGARGRRAPVDRPRR